VKSRRILNNIYLIGGPGITRSSDCLIYLINGGTALALVDCGAGDSWPQIQDNIAGLKLNPSDIEYLILTHAHIDHTGAANSVKKDTQCQILAHKDDAEALIEGDPIKTAANSYDVEMSPIPVDIVMESHTMSMDVGQIKINLMHTPGHTPGSIVVWMESEGKKVVFAQDVHGPFHKQFGSNVNQWAQSMKELMALKADVLCEGHYGIYKPNEAVNQYIQSQLKSYGYR